MSFPAALNHRQFTRSILTGANCRLNPTVSGSGAWGREAGAAPGTRETVVVGYDFHADGPIRVYGVNYVSLSGLTAGSVDIKLKFALFSSDGNFWRGVAGQNSALPETYLGGDAAAEAFSVMRAAGAGAAGRVLMHAFANPIDVPAGKFWLLMASEMMGSADTDITGLSAYAENGTIYPHEEMGGGGGGAPRGIVYTTLHTTGIDTSFDWNTYANADPAGVAQATSTSIVASKTITGVMAGLNWGLICEPI